MLAGLPEYTPCRVKELEKTTLSGDVSTGADEQDQYLATRFQPDPRRDAVWKHVEAYLSRWWTADASVLDVGAGYCSFINAVRARRRVAVDLHSQLDRHAHPSVECIRASATSIPALNSDAFDVVFASNLLEHLSREEIPRALAEFRRLLKPEGRLILLQPNYRLCSRRYFDDFTHLTPLSEISLGDLLNANGFRLLDVQPRFLPFSLKSRLAGFSFLLPIYLRLPYRPRAAQMLLVSIPMT